MAFNDLVAQKIKDFEQQGVPQVFERDLDLGNPQEPKRDNIVNVIVGARRCGKTYRLYQEMQRLQGQGIELDRMLYFNFEDERLRPYEPSLLADVLDTFYALYPAARTEGAYIFFDEIQEIPEWGAFLRRVVDTEKATVYVTGSSSKMLSAELKSEFRGRSLVRELFPMSFSEYVRYNTGAVSAPDAPLSSSDAAVLRNQLSGYLERGGFIATLDQAPADAIQLLQEYASRTVAMDVVERFDIRNPRLASLFLARCMASSGRELSVNKVYNEFKSRQIPVSRNTLSDLLAYYEDAYLLFSVSEFSRSLASNTRSASKVYAADPAMFGAFSPAAVSDQGQRLETAVFNALRRRTPAARTGSVCRLLFKNGSRNHEVDFVAGDALLMQAYDLVQVSVEMTNEKTREREIAALDAAMAQFGLGESTIVTMDEQADLSCENGVVHTVPAWRWLLA